MGDAVEYRYDDVVLTSDTDIPEEEAKAYILHLQEKLGNTLQSVHVTIDGDYADLSYKFQESNEPFERIRRITGYLVGTLDRFNDGKRAEEADRVKHSL